MNEKLFLYHQPDQHKHEVRLHESMIFIGKHIHYITLSLERKDEIISVLIQIRETLQK